METRVVVLHGFDDEELLTIVRAVKAVVRDPESVAFASTTTTNLGWKVDDLVDHVRQEHAAWTNRPKAKAEGGA